MNEPAPRIAPHSHLPRASNKSCATSYIASCAFPSQHASMHTESANEHPDSSHLTCNMAPPLTIFRHRSKIRTLSRLIMSHRQKLLCINSSDFCPSSIKETDIFDNNQDGRRCSFAEHSHTVIRAARARLSQPVRRTNRYSVLHC
jgi:hypothetical protein